MNKVIDIVFKDIRRDRSIYISLILVVIIAVLFGTFFIKVLSIEDKKTLVEHINLYFENIKNNNISNNLYNNLLNNNITLFIIWILGFSVIGLPFIIIILFYKGFSLSFTVASLLYNFKFDGIFVSLIYIFPHLIINLLFYFITTYYSFKMCTNLIQVLLNKDRINKKLLKKCIIILLISIIFLSLSSLYETFILPYLIKIIY